MIRTDTVVGAYFRAAQARKGPHQAMVATAHTIARIVYHLLKYGERYAEERAAVYEHQRQERDMRQLSQRAAKLGYTRTPIGQTPESNA